MQRPRLSTAAGLERARATARAAASAHATTLPPPARPRSHRRQPARSGDRSAAPSDRLPRLDLLAKGRGRDVDPPAPRRPPRRERTTRLGAAHARHRAVRRRRLARHGDDRSHAAGLPVLRPPGPRRRRRAPGARTRASRPAPTVDRLREDRAHPSYARAGTGRRFRCRTHRPGDRRRRPSVPQFSRRHGVGRGGAPTWQHDRGRPARGARRRSDPGQRAPARRARPPGQRSAVAARGSPRRAPGGRRYPGGVSERAPGDR